MTSDREATLHAQARRGAEAQALLDSGLMQAVFGDLRQQCIAKWENTAPADADVREDLWRHLHAIAAIERVIKGIAGSGRKAESDLNRPNSSV